MLKVCEKCNRRFTTRLSLVKRGWGKYCSRKCQYSSHKTGVFLACNICGVEIYRRKARLSRSKSGKYFCSKTCQTKWRNSYFIGSRHLQWKEGRSVYRCILLRAKVLQRCGLCRLRDKRLLVVHHKDENRNNNKVENLMWLCHNCHHLVHHRNSKKEKITNIFGV